MWRGAIRLWRLAQDKPRWVGLFGLVIAAAGSLSSIAWGWGVPKPQMRWCVAVWLIAAVIAIILSWGRRDLVRYFSLLLEARLTIRGKLVPLRHALGYGVITCLLAAGIAMQLGIGLNNLRQLPESDPDIQAAQWIKVHSAPSTVIMARKESLVYHYSQRRVIWFPPSSDTRLLMEGIRKYHVQQVVVVDRENSYWKPSDADSFRALSEAYPNTFVPIYKGPHSKVFAVSS